MDLLTFLRLGKRLLRLVTVLVFLRPRLANVYYNNDLHICFVSKLEFRNKFLSLPFNLIELPFEVRIKKKVSWFLRNLFELWPV